MMAKPLISDSLIAKFRDFLADMMGLYYPPAALKEFEKKLQVIAKAFGFSQVPDCLEWLMRGKLSIEQINVLAHHLTIGETYFFRDKNAFALLEKIILPKLIQSHKKDKRLRIWSAACCTGEEPYSLAILLQRLLPKESEWTISILATDINHEFLNKAKNGIYKTWSFRAVGPEIKERYFRKNKDNGFALIPEIKKMVKYGYLNLVEESYPDPSRGIESMDLIICSNVLIYFSPKQITKTIKQLSQSLSEGGWLLVSPIESPYVKEKSLKLMDMDGYAAFQKINGNDFQETKKAPTVNLNKAEYSWADNEDALSKMKLPAVLKLSQSTLQFDAEVVPASQTAFIPQKVEKDRGVSPLIKELHDETKVVEHIQNLANAGKLHEARDCCEKALQQDRLDPLLHYMLATILHFANDDVGAIQALKKAIFLNDQFALAHFTLGVLMKNKHQDKEAQRYLRNAHKLLERSLPDEIVPGSEGMTAATLLDVINQYQG